MQVAQSAKPPLSQKRSEQVKPASRSATDLIRLAKEHPPVPIVQGLLNEEEILLLHGSEDSYKSFFVLQVADSIASGRSLFAWDVPQARRVGVIETELNEASLGERLARIFPGNGAPENLRFLSEGGLRDWKRLSLLRKIAFAQRWVQSEGIQVLMIDTANDFFRGADNASQERSVGQFFDELRAIEVDARLIVRHDRKKNDNGGNPNDRIRGASEWKEDPEVIVSLKREDRRTNEVVLSVDKQRYGRKPDALTLWFDTEVFRLDGLPPVIDVLWSGKQSRREILEACHKRFSLGQRKVDDMLAHEREFLREQPEGREKYFEIDLEKVPEACWVDFLHVRTPELIGGKICNRRG
jgi:RecA-family ATPase